jgi:uncharacterized protein YkwD
MLMMDSNQEWLRMRKCSLILSAILSAYVLLLASCGPEDGEDSDGTGGDCGMSGSEMRLLEFINDARARGRDCGGTYYSATHALECHTALVTAARSHSTDMAENDYFSHTSLDGRSFSDRIRDAGYTEGGYMGENIAAGPSDPAAILDLWLESPSHCSTMMNPSFHLAGVGWAFSSTSTYNNYWTLDLASGGSL